MCGITGIFNLDGGSVDIGLLTKMADSIKHRGPNGEGYLLVNIREKSFELAGGNDTPEAVFSSTYPFSPRQKIGVFVSQPSNFNLAFGHRRLAIIDLSPAGHQPMCNEDGTIWIIYNGEIYNYLELRKELKGKGYRFITNTDTEVILYSYQEWGHKCLNRFNGMWSFAIWDARKTELFCSRDRFGVKPFYYFFDDNTFAFASEIKALLLCPFIVKKANDKTIYFYLSMGISDGKSETFFENIRQLEPGQYAIVKETGLELKRYYTLAYNPELGKYSEPSLQEYSQEFVALLKDAVRVRLRSDVSVGSCLSGGLDSSAIVCIINKFLMGKWLDEVNIGKQQRTFSSCFEHEAFDERKFIEEITSITNTSAYYVFPSGEQMWQELDSLVWQQEEPFGSTSIYAQWNVMRLAQQNNVKVLLDGQGGDELLGGYHTYFTVYLANLILNIQGNAFLKEFKMLVSDKVPSLYIFSSLLLPLYNLIPPTLRTFVRSKIIRSQNRSLINKSLLKKYQHDYTMKVETNLQKALWKSETGHGLRELLRYEDKNSMAFSIEARTPFIDYRLVELVFSIPGCYKIHNGWTKYLLRDSTKGLLPEKVRWRRDKMGFPTPEKIWLKESRNKIKNIFASSDSLMSEQYLDRKVILANLDHILDENNVKGFSALWKPINLELWLRKMF